jgi:hypothetical protein
MTVALWFMTLRRTTVALWFMLPRRATVALWLEMPRRTTCRAVVGPVGADFRAEGKDAVSVHLTSFAIV